MSAINVLVLTDHSSHKPYDSVYALPRAMSAARSNTQVMVSSRAISRAHFNCKTTRLECAVVDNEFTFDNRQQYFDASSMVEHEVSDFDLIFLRIDRPVSNEYLLFLEKTAGQAAFVNSPSGIIHTGPKTFLSHFADLCPGFAMCKSLEHAESLSGGMPIVLKPLDGYGGVGLVRFNSRTDIWVESQHLTGDSAIEYWAEHEAATFPCTSMKYLKNVDKGDKRILVVAGECLGGVLRVPAEGAWLCNLMQGATAQIADIEPEEEVIVSRVDKKMREHGILVYGIDTLVGDDEKRVLSEINSTNVGGFIQLEEQTGRAILTKTATLIFDALELS